ncbi:MAG: class I SAM-dependent methyltransferase [Vicinamibacterales bacterium]
MTEHQDIVRTRFARTAARQAALEERRRADLRSQVGAFASFTGDERALDVGCGTGALAFALSPYVREVVGVDLVPELLAEGRARTALFPNVEFAEGNATQLGFETASFDLAGCLRTLHHMSEPERVIEELLRVVRPGGRLLVIDQLAYDDVERAEALDHFERVRDPSHTRCVTDACMRERFNQVGATVVASRVDEEQRNLEKYLDLAGCEGAHRAEAAALAPGPMFTSLVGWYLLARP